MGLVRKPANTTRQSHLPDDTEPIRAPGIWVSHTDLPGLPRTYLESKRDESTLSLVIQAPTLSWTSGHVQRPALAAGGNWPQAAGLASSWAPGALLGRGFRSLPQPHVNRWQNKFLIKRKKVSGSARLFMIFRSLWCSFFPFVFLEPESAYCHPALGLGSLG